MSWRKSKCKSTTPRCARSRVRSTSTLFGQTGTPDQQPYCFEVNGGELFAFAGLWDRWKDPSGNWVKTCSILTTTPNTVTSPVHDRMPVILDPDSYDLWLDPGDE